ncbi:MAG: MmcQ/YjbR family DNA-binding protein [Thermoanaerobaculia bacterium]
MTKTQNDAQALIDRVREFALTLPGATEKLSHGEPAYFVRKRMFFNIDNHHHGSGHLAVWCNAPPGVQESLVAAEPRHFFVPPYVGKAGWLGVKLDSGLAWKRITDLLTQAHAITGVKPKTGRLRL